MPRKTSDKAVKAKIKQEEKGQKAIEKKVAAIEKQIEKLNKSLDVLGKRHSQADDRIVALKGKLSTNEARAA